MTVKAHLSLLSIFAIAPALGLSLLAGCSDECSVGDSKCLNDTVIRYCAKDKDGDPAWIQYPCGTGTKCATVDEESETKETLKATADASASDGGDQSSDKKNNGATVDKCVGICTKGASECVTTELSRYCVDSASWALDPCNVGESCDPQDGKCKVSSTDAVKVCTAGSTACVGKNWKKVCDSDGSDWRLEQCKSWEICSDGKCAPDPNQSCDKVGAGWCVDAKTAVRCNSITGGYETVVCDKETYCTDGRCWGSVCAVGSTCLTGAAAPTAQENNPAGTVPTQIIECIDGVDQKVSECSNGQVCRQNGDNAECITPECVIGMSVCGSPKDASVDKTKTYSLCSVGTKSKVPEWQLVQCTGNLVCDPMVAISSGSIAAEGLCRSECTPGAQVCTGDAVTGVANGYRECKEDGTWGAIVDCNPDAVASKICISQDLLTHDTATLYKVNCADPICAVIATSPISSGQHAALVEGVCSGIQIKTCGTDGRLQETAQNCPTGFCRNSGSTAQSDGYIRGFCDVDIGCTDGESRCMNPGYDSVYQSCDKGLWSTQLQRCTNDKTCFTTKDAAGLLHHVCGGDCAPGTTRCYPEDETDAVQIQKCKADGTWGDSQKCSLGLCKMVTDSDPTTGMRAEQAQCVLQCRPGEVGCTGESQIADDGFSVGRASARTCKPDGTWPDSEKSSDSSYFSTCSGTTACRISAYGISTGCVQCVGTGVLGGNEYGFVDTACDNGQYKSCGADNKWQAATSCGPDTECRPPESEQQVCRTCLSGLGNTVVCTNTLVNDTAICGQCVPALDRPEVVCTQTNIAAARYCGQCTAGNGTEVVCTQSNLLANAVCGTCTMGNGTTTVCSQTNLAANAAAPNPTWTTCAAANYGTPGNFGGVTDCCSSRQQYGTCANLSYGSPGLWGSYTDCCSSFRVGATTCSAMGYGSAAAWGSVSDCCSSYRTGTTSTCVSLGYGTASSGMWGGYTGCCSDAQDIIPAHEYAICE